MCGILGIALGQGELSDSKIRKALRVMTHRGPDGEGVWINDQHNTGLGHCRLSVIGINNGQQPVSNETRTIHAVVNGEFYDYRNLRLKLETQGHHFYTESDSELLVHLYEEQGVACLKALRGEFAFILYDEHKKSLFAARDRFGIKPLVYSNQPEGLFLSSEAKALFAAGVQPEWDLEAFFYSSSMQYQLPDQTHFRDINQLLPGHYLVLEDRTLTVHQYWDLPIEEIPKYTVTDSHREQELIHHCREQIVESVKLRLESDVPLGFHLSGGLDSSSILGIASHLREEPLNAFVIGFAIPEYQEQYLAQETAKYCGATLQTIHITSNDLLDVFELAVQSSEGLAINGHLSAKYLLNQAIQKQGIKVVLTGEGADELFTGYAHLKADACQEASRPELMSDLINNNRSSMGMMVPFGDSLSLQQMKDRLGYIPTFLQAKATLGKRIQSLLCDDFLVEFRNRDPFSEMLERINLPACFKERSQVQQSTWLWSKTALANYILKTLGDGTEMPSSIEGRVPFLDHQLVESQINIPHDMKIRGTTEKYILREAVKGFVTPEVYTRPKHPLDAPPLTLFSTDRQLNWFRERLQSPWFEKQPFFSYAKTMKLLDLFPTFSEIEKQCWDPVFMIILSTLSLQQLVSKDN